MNKRPKTLPGTNESERKYPQIYIRVDPSTKEDWLATSELIALVEGSHGEWLRKVLSKWKEEHSDLIGSLRKARRN